MYEASYPGIICWVWGFGVLLGLGFRVYDFQKLA